MYQWLISFARPIQYSFPFPLPQLELERWWTLNCFQFNVLEDAAFFLLVQESISIRVAECGKIAFGWHRFCQYLMFPVCCYDGQGSAFFFKEFNGIRSPLHLSSSKALNTTKIIFGKKMTSQLWRIKHSHLIIPFNCFVSSWPTWSFNIVERSNFFLSVFLLEVNATKKLPLSWKDIKDLLSTAPNNWLHSLKIWPKCAGWGSIDKSCVTLTYLRWFKHE